ncbi:MAG: PQQ-binding-like beta-propeller repeat protein [Sandaracinaceae bacterium]|nr:PQQ-binding-like beta-propeller repeat protein [Sandaracinaceae bacterium]
MRSSTLVLSGLLMVSLGCGAAPVEPRAREEPSSSERAAPTTAVVWRRAGTKVLGVDGTRAFAWERAGESQNVIVATSVATGAELSRLPLEAAPYIGEPRAWWSIGEASVVHWHGLGRVQEGAAAWTAGAVTRPFSTSQPAPADTLLVADSYRVVRLRVDGEPLWTHELPRGAQPPEFYVDAATVGLAFQQYSTTSPTTQLSIPHRVRSIALHDGAERWTRDFTENLGAVHVRGDVLVIAQGADLVFLDGATGEERVRHPALGPPSIYPRIVSDDAHVVVALDPFVRAYDLRGTLLWQTRGRARQRRAGGHPPRRPVRLHGRRNARAGGPLGWPPGVARGDGHRVGLGVGHAERRAGGQRRCACGRGAAPRERDARACPGARPGRARPLRRERGAGGSPARAGHARRRRNVHARGGDRWLSGGAREPHHARRVGVGATVSGVHLRGRARRLG